MEFEIVNRSKKMLSGHLDGAYLAILGNAGTLLGTTGTSALLGFLYWWVAAVCFPSLMWALPRQPSLR